MPSNDQTLASKCPCNEGYKCMESLNNCVLDVQCPPALKFGKGPPENCPKPTDPNNKPPSKLEEWFTQEVFDDLFPKANIGWGPSDCWPYSYQAFKLAARYFPRFGTESISDKFTAEENHRRDLAAFFSHAVQETGENDPSIYEAINNPEEAHACFYRGGFYNWFEGGPTSMFLPEDSPGHDPTDGDKCQKNGRYCQNDLQSNILYDCADEKDGDFFKGCYFGRGAIQISYNYNYGLFQQFLDEQNIQVDILQNPNLVMTKMNPPLAIMASIWFYMTPQPPKPSMHDIVMGNWHWGSKNEQAGYSGPVFGPTSLIINNECNGEDYDLVGGGGENRRIKAFKWFTDYFGVPLLAEGQGEETLSCKNMVVPLEQIKQYLSYGPDWSSTWKESPCQCVPHTYPGRIPYFEEGFYPDSWVSKNAQNKKRCETILYAHPAFYNLDEDQACLKHEMGSQAKSEGPDDVEKSVDIKAKGSNGVDVIGRIIGSGVTKSRDIVDCAVDDAEFMPSPGSTKKYIWCITGRGYVMNCPAGTIFNQKKPPCG